jgi:ubiquitin carboxyl-terminal hydrolase 5/13
MSKAVNGFTLSAEPCPHCWDDSAAVKPSLSSKVYKDECNFCFTTSSETVFVCLKCHKGTCVEHLGYHNWTGHTLFLAITKLPKPEKKDPVTDLSQLGVEPPDEFETAVVCKACSQQFPLGVGITEDATKAIQGALSPQLQATIADQGANSFAKLCPHAEKLVQPAERSFYPGHPPASDEKCANCDHRLNNWICLACGAIGCPRQEAGGQAHAMLHYMMTGHCVVVKNGTVTPAGADLYCYACDDDVRDPNLREHLAALGIQMESAVKTAKSMAELQLDQTAKFDFGKISESGKDLVPRYGPGFTGLINLGNSCYMASVLQAVLAIPEFRARYYENPTLAAHQGQCRQDTADCYSCQFWKLAHGYYSGEHSQEGLPKHRLGIAPRDFKTFITKGHKDFSTGEQQDAEEFLRYFLLTLSRKEMARQQSTTPAPLKEDPGRLFEFLVEERKQCSACGGVRYTRNAQTTLAFNIPVQPPADPSVKLPDDQRPRVSLDDCLTAMLLPQDCECRCESCGVSPAIYQTTFRVATFPTVFALHPRREYLDRTTYTTKKLDVFVDAPEVINLERIRGRGLQAGEREMMYTSPASAAANAGGEAPVDEEGLALLMSMGIELETAQWALRQTGNNMERAVDWVFSHPEGPPTASAESAPTPQPRKQADLEVATDGEASYELFAMVSHIGSSALTGHYIAHVKKGGSWTIFNDEKVAFSQDPPFSMASIYFYRRKE